MNQLNVYYRALHNYREETVKDRECTLDRASLVRVNTDSDKIVLKRNFCTVDLDWVEAIENGLVFIEKAIKEERQFIRSNGEVIPIEKVRNVSKASVEHLAKHSNLITREVEGEDLIPDQLFTVEKLNDYAVYENRFLYMLLCYLKDFVTLRYNNILELSYTYDGSMTMNKTVSLPKQSLTYQVNLEEKRKDDKYLMQSSEIRDIIDRIDLVLKAILAFISCPLMKLVAKAPMLKPPITRTNVLKMNNNFKQAMALYSFIVAYDKPGYTVETKVTELTPFRDDLADEMAESALMASFLTYEYGLGINSVLKEEYEEEERQRKDAEYRRRQEKLESVHRRVLSMEESPEEYIMMLEKQIRALENKCSDFESVSGELKLTKQRLADEVEHTKKLTKALDDTTEALNNLRIEYAAEVKRLEEEHETRIRALTEQYEAEISNIKAEHEQLVAEMTERYESELAELRTAHATEIISLKEQHAEKIGALESKHEAELSAERENHSRELAERDVNIAALINNVAIVKADMERAADEFEKEKAELLKENERLVEDKRVANANIYLLRGEKGQESEDFTSQMSFDELERTYHAFTRFYKEQWRMTKKAIRKDLLKAKEAKKDGDANES